jgi:hypothetical protein
MIRTCSPNRCPRLSHRNAIRESYVPSTAGMAQRVTRTGHSARRTTRSATLPKPGRALARTIRRILGQRETPSSSGARACQGLSQGKGPR